MSAAAYNLDLVHRMYDALNRQDLEAHHQFWREDMVWHGPPGFGDIHGIKGFQEEVLKPFYKAFPDYFAKNDIEVADDSMVSATGFVTGHQRGEWLGFQPTGKFMRMRFSDFWSVKDGKLHENWVMVDHVDVMKQLGVDLMAGIKGGH